MMSDDTFTLGSVEKNVEEAIEEIIEDKAQEDPKGGDNGQ